METNATATSQDDFITRARRLNMKLLEDTERIAQERRQSATWPIAMPLLQVVVVFLSGVLVGYALR